MPVSRARGADASKVPREATGGGLFAVLEARGEPSHVHMSEKFSQSPISRPVLDFYSSRSPEDPKEIVPRMQPGITLA
jgi:hypothetical protein